MWQSRGDWFAACHKTSIQNGFRKITRPSTTLQCLPLSWGCYYQGIVVIPKLWYLAASRNALVSQTKILFLLSWHKRFRERATGQEQLFEWGIKEEKSRLQSNRPNTERSFLCWWYSSAIPRGNRNGKGKKHIVLSCVSFLAVPLDLEQTPIPSPIQATRGLQALHHNFHLPAFRQPVTEYLPKEEKWQGGQTVVESENEWAKIRRARGHAG